VVRRDHVGNVALVAAWDGPKGSVLVFGDTSPFINRNMPHNEIFVRDLFTYLCRATETGTTLFRLAAIVAMTWSFACIAAAVALGGRSRLTPRRGQLLAVAAWLPLAFLCFSLEPSLPEAKAASPCLFLSTEENNVFSRDGFSPYGFTSLGVTAQQAGLSVKIGEWESATPQDAVFIINPTREVPFQRLVAHADAGGTAVVAGGGGNPQFRDFAKALGVVVGEEPLGALEGPNLRTYCAWAISADAARWEPLKAGKHSVGLVRTAGKGRLVLIADEGFFYTKNLEDAATHNGINADFIKSLLSG